jgi:hypothetical protein
LLATLASTPYTTAIPATPLRSLLTDPDDVRPVDDFNAWVTGPSAEDNTRAIQQKILPRVEAWAKESGAIFEAEKTGLIHFTSSAKARWDTAEEIPFSFEGQEINPKESVKVLGVTLDTKLKMDTHLSKVMVLNKRGGQ